MARSPLVIARLRAGLVLLSCALILSACTSGSGEVQAPDSFPADAGAEPNDQQVERPRGGSARVGVWAEPDVAALHLGGAAVRALVYPQLFIAGPRGTWIASLAEPGSDRTAADRRSASFALRSDAVWSDGAPITVDDLRRTADARFVSGVETDTAGRVVVTFTQPLPGWRRLWSFTDSIAPPRPGVWGGPFVMAEFTDGLEAVLRPNDQWWGSGPFLEEVRLVLVPNWVTSIQLLDRGELDVVMPPAATARVLQLDDMAGVEVATSNRSGWWTGLHLNPERLDGEARLGVIETVDRSLFVGTLLKEEATVLNGLAGPEDATWAGVAAGDAEELPPAGEAVDLVGMIEEPLNGLLQRSMQKRARPPGARLELRNAEVERVSLWLAGGEFDAGVSMEVDSPALCWTCRFAAVDERLAREADAGSAEAAAALQARLRDDRLLLPLWRHRAATAWRPGLNGVAVNGYALNGAWNAWEWWREP